MFTKIVYVKSLNAIITSATKSKYGVNSQKSIHPDVITPSKIHAQLQ